jgi:hypothetical protein
MGQELPQLMDFNQRSKGTEEYRETYSAAFKGARERRGKLAKSGANGPTPQLEEGRWILSQLLSGIKYGTKAFVRP